MEKSIETIKLVLTKSEKNINNFSIDALPKEEAKVFVSALKMAPNFLIKLDHSYFDIRRDEIEKWAVIYINLHNLFHSEYNDSDINKLEILTTVPIWTNLPELIAPQEQRKINLAYFLLGLSALKINHNLENLISEKIILGEFLAFGGIEKGIWGLKLKDEILPNVVKNILEKTQKNNHHQLVKKYKNFIFDFL